MQALGFNYRITDFQCALGLSQLDRLDALVAERNRVAARYRELLADEDRDRAAPAGGRRVDCTATTSSSCGCSPGPDARLGGLRRAPRRRASASRSTTSRSIAIRTTATSLGYPQDECPAAEEYYAGAISLPMFPRHERSRRRASRQRRCAGRCRDRSLLLAPFRPVLEIGGRRVGPRAARLRNRRGRRQPQPRSRPRKGADRRSGGCRSRRREVPDLHRRRPLLVEDATLRVPQGRPEPARAARRDRAPARLAAGPRRARRVSRGSRSSRRRSTTMPSTVWPRSAFPR